ncbi:MAG: hypothetical protein HWN71_03110 [Desulfobacterales bacterium]|nr:hypothetical protein [Desulfobacterales bacterium]
MNDIAKSMEYAEKIMKQWKPTRITFGEGSINRVGEAVKRYSDKYHTACKESDL